MSSTQDLADASGAGDTSISKKLSWATRWNPAISPACTVSISPSSGGFPPARDVRFSACSAAGTFPFRSSRGLRSSRNSGRMRGKWYPASPDDPAGRKRIDGGIRRLHALSAVYDAANIREQNPPLHSCSQHRVYSPRAAFEPQQRRDRITRGGVARPLTTDVDHTGIAPLSRAGLGCSGCNRCLRDDILAFRCSPSVEIVRN